MKIVVTGTRGIPDVLGGVETHCQELYPRLAAMGHDVTVIRRSCYVDNENPRLTEYKGVRLKDVFAPRKKSIEAIIHTFLAVLQARAMNPDVLHIHAIGPSLLTPFARLLGMKVVTTNHGPDYDRGKWGRMAKWVLRTGERMGTRFANRVIVISQLIADNLANLYGRKDTDLIFNGVTPPVKSERTDYIESLGLTPGKYVMGLARFVPEKNFHQLIEAFEKAAPRGYKLVLAGDADHEDEYSRALKEQARRTGVVLTGFIKGEKLNQLLTNAGLFVLPSSHEGLPISLLEAMSYGLDVLASDIGANRIAALEPADFFPVGDIDAMASAITRKLAAHNTLSDSGMSDGGVSERAGRAYRTYDLTPYDWDRIARQTEAVYKSIV